MSFSSESERRSPALVALSAAAGIAQTPTPERVLKTDAWVVGLAFSRDGTTVVGARRDGASVWDVKSGVLLRTVRWGFDFTFGTAVAPGGNLLAAGGVSQVVKVWDLSTGNVVQDLTGRTGVPEGYLYQFSEDASLLATSSQGHATLWELPSGRVRFDIAFGHGATVAFAFSADNQLLAAANEDTSVRVWTTRDGRDVTVIDDLPLLTPTLKFSHDSRLLFSGNMNRSIYTWDTETWRLSRRFESAPEAVWSIDLSPDGRLLATGGVDPNGVDLPAHLVLWDIASGKALRTIRLPHSANQVAFSPDGSLIGAANLADGLALWPVSGLTKQR